MTRTSDANPFFQLLVISKAVGIEAFECKSHKTSPICDPRIWVAHRTEVAAMKPLPRPGGTSGGEISHKLTHAAGARLKVSSGAR
jgi:hypothetical protein